MKYIDNKIFREEYKKSRISGEPTESLKDIFEHIINRRIMLFTFNKDIRKVPRSERDILTIDMFKWYINERLYGYLWTKFNLEKINEPNALFNFFHQLIRDLYICAYKKSDFNINVYLRKQKLEQIFNLRQD